MNSVSVLLQKFSVPSRQVCRTAGVWKHNPRNLIWQKFWLQGQCLQYWKVVKMSVCDWHGGPTELVQHFACREVHIGARALLDIKLEWFGYIARLSQWGGGRCFTRSNYFYLNSERLKEGGGGGVRTLWVYVTGRCKLGWVMSLADVSWEGYGCLGAKCYWVEFAWHWGYSLLCAQHSQSNTSLYGSTYPASYNKRKNKYDTKCTYLRLLTYAVM
jgi:hypothetical protein